jgi:soluble lytic murein transglycosylase
LKLEVQEILKTPGKQSGQLLKALLWASTLFLCIIPAGSAKSPNIFSDCPELPKSLREWSSIYSFEATQYSKSLKKGIDLYSSNQYAAAISVLQDVAVDKSNLLGDYILLYRAKSKFMLKRHEDAIEDFQTLLTRRTDSPLFQEALSGQCKALLESNNPKALLAKLGDPRIKTNSESTYLRARALDLSGEKNKAAELYLSIYSRDPNSKQAPFAQQYLLSIMPGAFKGAGNYEARLQRAENLLKGGDASSALAITQALGRFKAPNPASSTKRVLLLGEAEYRLGKTALALPHLRQITADNPLLHAKAIYLQGLCARKLEQTQSFIDLRDKGLQLYPNSPDIEELCYSVATYYDVECDSLRSKSAYRILLDHFAKGKYAERALWKLSFLDYFDKKYEDAAIGFWKYLTSYPTPLSAGPAIYWIGKCYEKSGDPSRAKHLYERAHDLINNHYYGRLAHDSARRLGKAETAEKHAFPRIDFDDLLSNCKAIKLSKIKFSDPDDSSSKIIQRAQQLEAVGLSDLALSELRAGARQRPEDEHVFCYIMSRICEKEGNYNGAIACLRKAIPDYMGRPIDALPEEIWELLFPVRHLSAIAEHASRTSVDSNLVLGLIRQESAFEEDALSKANARGLMQVLPSTGRKLAKQVGITRFTPKKLFQAETNISLGVRYLASMINTFGKPELALAAYNAGGSRVERWMKAYGELEMPEFIEQIPFSETRGYVKQVLSNRAQYDLLTSGTSR